MTPSNAAVGIVIAGEGSALSNTMCLQGRLKSHNVLSRAHYLPLSPQTNPLVAWAAGFIEGEGSFYSNPTTHSLKVDACQATDEPLRRLASLFGGTVRWHKSKWHKPGGIWRWQVYGSAAFDVIAAIYPYMTQKRRAQIHKALANWNCSVRRPRNFRGLTNPAARSSQTLKLFLRAAICGGEKTESALSVGVCALRPGQGRLWQTRPRSSEIGRKHL